MGWKTINCRRYYYKSERDGGRVKTTYFGAGESGLLMSLLQLEDRAEREAELEGKRAEREADDAEDRAVSSWFDDVQAVADAAMLAAGYHKHKGSSSIGTKPSMPTPTDGASPNRIFNIARSTKPMLDSFRRFERWRKSASWRCQPSK